MEFKFSDEHNALRTEVRGFLDAALPKDRGAGPVRPTSQENWPEQMEFAKKLAAKGWIAPAWPKEYGGGGLTIMEQFIFNQEILPAGASYWVALTEGYLAK